MNATYLMLVTDWPAEGRSIRPGRWLWSEKLDGVRALWDGTRLRSRGGNAIDAPRWFTRDLPAGQPLDGELWAGRGRFRDAVAAARGGDDHPGWADMVFCVFDAPRVAGDVRQRLAAAGRLVRRAPRAKLVNHRLVRDQGHVDRVFAAIVAEGGEGIVVREVDATYTPGRSRSVLRRKAIDQTDAVVIGHRTGVGTMAGMVSALVVMCPDGTQATVTAGLTLEERRDPPRVNETVVIGHQGWTSGGQPRHARYHGTRYEQQTGDRQRRRLAAQHARQAAESRPRFHELDGQFIFCSSRDVKQVRQTLGA